MRRQAVSKPRTFRFDWELDDAAETPVTVVATVSGRDERWSPQVMSPPECREVEIEVRSYFCPSEPDKCAGCEYEDVTDKAGPAWLEHRTPNKSPD